MDQKKMYGKIGLCILFDICVYLDNKVIYDDMIE